MYNKTVVYKWLYIHLSFLEGNEEIYHLYKDYFVKQVGDYMLVELY